MVKRPSKKAKTSGKRPKKVKQTKRPPKKLGLAKFMPSTNKKIKQPRDVDHNEDDSKPTFQKDSSCKRDKADIPNLKSEKRHMNLVERCRLQMSSSLLRLMDETLYTNDSNSVSLDENEFIAYHDAYKSVSEKWPSKPIDYIVKFIKKRILVKKRPLHKIRFADIGCGREPLLKMKLPPKANVVSFDLVSTCKDVTMANMERIPIESESIHCSVYSLSLMAKNLGNVILEGKRILKVGGSMLIVEVTSRFEGRERNFTNKLEKLGLKQKSISALKPNGFFTFFHFTKVDSKTDYSSSSLNIQLKPCVYKAR